MKCRSNSEIEASATGRAAQVIPGSPAAGAGVQKGDAIISLAGHRLRDVIDYQFYLEPGVQSLEVERDGRVLSLQLVIDEVTDAGIIFESALFDGVRACRNRCLFCFVDQLPRNLRRPLYLKDGILMWCQIYLIELSY